MNRPPALLPLLLHGLLLLALGAALGGVGLLIALTTAALPAAAQTSGALLLGLLLSAAQAGALAMALRLLRRGLWTDLAGHGLRTLLPRLGQAAHADPRLDADGVLHLRPPADAPAHRRLHAAALEARWRPRIALLLRSVHPDERRRILP